MDKVVVIKKAPIPRGPFLVAGLWFTRNMTSPFKRSFTPLESPALSNGVYIYETEEFISSRTALTVSEDE